MKTINTSATDSIRTSIKNYADKHNWLNELICFVIHHDDVVVPENRNNNLKILVAETRCCRRCGDRRAMRIKK